MYKLENYNIIGEKYKGGMGEVYHLYHKEWNIDVAYKQPLKELLKTKEDKERFYQECERWIGLGIHPNIVQLYFFNEENHIPGAFMEWMNQGSLLDYINSQELYQGTNQEIILRILDIAIQSAKGLHYAHSQGILHLDVKPANILLDEDSVKITDFGISSFLNQKSSGYTLLYCAPEQQVQGTVNERTDIYCWAVTLLHMLVKEAIWFDGYVAGLAYDQYLDDSPLDIPESLRVLLGQCLESDNEKRIHDFKIVIEKLINIYNTLSFIEYSRDDEKYASISLDAYNNTAISYYHLGYKEKAGIMWLRGYWHNLYHISSYYNYQLYLYRHQGSMDAHFFDTQLKSRQLKESLSDKEGYQQLKQDWYQSVKMNLSLPLKTIDLNKYQLDSKKCILLSYIYNNHILYVNEKAEMYIIDDINKKNMKYKTQLIQAHKATISKNKRYLALAYHDPKISDTYEIRVIDLKEMKYILTISGKEKIYT